MSFFLIYSLLIFFFAAIPVCLFYSNGQLFLRATQDPECLLHARQESVSILIPARNEASSIGLAIDSILQNRFMHFELLVLDDQSTDETAAIVRQWMQRSEYIRLIDSIPLPDGWNGKQHACWRLAEASQFDWLLFLDADVRLTEDGIERTIAEGLRTQVALLSGFPFQETKSFSEKLLIPLMHFILLGYLPIARLRKSTAPSLSAGCGQLMLASRKAYFACDGHRAIRSSRHDGIRLPRAFREYGMTTDIFDASDIATCRMYHNRHEVVAGLLKNAHEGIANPRLIVIFSILLLGASVLPIPSLIVAFVTHQTSGIIGVLSISNFCVFLPRILAAIRWKQSWMGVVFHPISVAWFVGIQWYAWLGGLFGQRIEWRGRKQ